MTYPIQTLIDKARRLADSAPAGSAVWALAERVKWTRKVSSRLALLSMDNLKLSKSNKGGESLNAALMLAPASTSGYNVCKWSTPGCRAACVASSGNGRFASVTDARIRRTLQLFHQRERFAFELGCDFHLLALLGGMLELEVWVRLNTFSDIPWERVPLYSDGSTAVDMARAQRVGLYDYTKSKVRAIAQPYRLTYSASERDNGDTIRDMARFAPVAVPFAGELPDTYCGLPVVDGDKDDARYRDRAGTIVGLHAKGSGRKDATGFVRFTRI